MKKLYYIYSVVAFLCFSLTVEAQDPYFSQYMNNPLELNPANAGLFQGKFRGIVNYRRQWENIGSAFQTIGASGDFQLAQNVFDQDLFGIGVNVVQDQTGIAEATNLNANLSVSYTKILDKYANHYLSLGFNLGFAQKALTLTDLRWDNQWTSTGFDTSIDPNEDNLSDATTHMDFGGGINYYYGNSKETIKGYFGLAAFHLNRPDVTFLGQEEILDTRVVVNGGLEFGRQGTPIKFFPNFVHFNQGNARQTVVGGDIKFLLKGGARTTGFLSSSSLALGMYHRFGSAFIPMVKLATGGFNIGISYDINIGGIPRANNGLGGPEFSLIYKGAFGKGGTTRKVNTKFM